MEYAFRPALLAPQIGYNLENGVLSGADRAQTFDLQKITHAALIRHSLRDSVMWRLDLHAGDQVFRAGYNGSRNWQKDPEALSFIALCSDVAREIGEVKPDFNVTWGEYGKLRTIWFMLGLVTLLGAFVIAGLALATGVSPDRLLAAGIPVGLMILLGGTLAWAYAPNRKPPVIPVYAVAGNLKAGLKR